MTMPQIYRSLLLVVDDVRICFLLCCICKTRNNQGYIKSLSNHPSCGHTYKGVNKLKLQYFMLSEHNMVISSTGSLGIVKSALTSRKNSVIKRFNYTG